MIKNYETQTKPLTDCEMHYAHIIGAGLKKRDKNNPINSIEICKRMNNAYPTFKLTDIRLRKMINYLRLTSLPNICATSAGYYCGNANDVREYLIGLKQRINAQIAIYNAATKYVKEN